MRSIDVSMHIPSFCTKRHRLFGRLAFKDNSLNFRMLLNTMPDGDWKGTKFDSNIDVRQSPVLISTYRPNYTRRPDRRGNVLQCAWQDSEVDSLLYLLPVIISSSRWKAGTFVNPMNTLSWPNKGLLRSSDKGRQKNHMCEQGFSQSWSSGALCGDANDGLPWWGCFIRYKCDVPSSTSMDLVVSNKYLLEFLCISTGR